MVLESSSGRSKIFGLVQYTAALYVSCMKHSDESWSCVQSLDKAEKLVNFLSSSRKLFKLMNFILVWKKTMKSSKDKTKTAVIWLLSLCLNLFSFLYHIGNNAHWLATMGFMSKYMRGNIKWKQFKDFFCLLKNIMDLVRSVLVYLNLFKSEQELLKEFELYDDDEFI